MKKVLLTLAVSLLVYSAEARAAVQSESLYVWKYEGGCFTLNYSYSNPSPRFFYISEKNDNDSILLFGNDSLVKTVNINKNGDTYSVFTESDTITLGTQPEFIFKFSNDGINYSKQYSLAKFPENSFTLHNSTTGMTVGLSCASGQLTVNEVPVPGAAFLLGSGLLGLIGIRSRRQ